MPTLPDIRRAKPSLRCRTHPVHEYSCSAHPSQAQLNPLRSSRNQVSQAIPRRPQLQCSHQQHKQARLITTEISPQSLVQSTQTQPFRSQSILVGKYIDPNQVDPAQPGPVEHYHGNPSYPCSSRLASHPKQQSPAQPRRDQPSLAQQSRAWYNQDLLTTATPNPDN